MSGPLGIAFQPGQIRQAKPKEFAIRFGFGGAITAMTGIIAHYFGPLVGGLFLAFPAILPASVTMLQHHADHKAASQDALGAAAGSIGLLAFAVLIWRLAVSLPAWLAILLAALVWLAVAGAVWAACVLVKRAATR